MRASLSARGLGADGLSHRARELVVGLVRRAKRTGDEDLDRAVCEREELIARRARELAGDAVDTQMSWARPFGAPPKDARVAEAWWDRLSVIAAYRERWHAAGPGILGEDIGTASLQQAAHRARARRAGQDAAVLAGIIAPQASVPGPWTAPSVSAERDIDI
jgi:hypothetical protein